MGRRRTAQMAVACAALLFVGTMPSTRPGLGASRADGVGPLVGGPARRGSTPPRVGELGVLLRHEGGGQYTLQEVALRRNGTVAVRSKVSLPSGLSYTGPVATSDDACAVLGSRPGSASDEVVAYRWRLGEAQVTQLAPPSAPLPHRLGWDVGLLSYSRVSGQALIALAIPEALADEPRVWSWRTGRSQRVRDAYPALHTIRDRWVTSACFSPDGSLLAVAVLSGGPHSRAQILVYDLKTRKVRTLAGPRQYVWALAISHDNRELCWLDTGYVYALVAFESSGRQVSLDEYQNTGYGILSLPSGRYRYRRVSQDASFRAQWPASPLTNQHTSTCAFSGDARSIYFVFNVLAQFDRKSRHWQRLSDDHVVGFALVPVSGSRK